MASIRGLKNPVPTKLPLAKGLFKQRGSGPAAHNSDVKSSAMKVNRVSPPASRNSGTSPGKSHYVNGGLKKGTSNRG